MSVYRVVIPLKVYGEADARRLAWLHEANGDTKAAAVLHTIADAIRHGDLKPDRPNEQNVYVFGGDL